MGPTSIDESSRGRGCASFDMIGSIGLRVSSSRRNEFLDLDMGPQAQRVDGEPSFLWTGHGLPALQKRHFSGFITGSGLIIRPYFRRGTVPPSDGLHEGHLRLAYLEGLRDILECIEMSGDVCLRVRDRGRPLPIRAGRQR